MMKQLLSVLTLLICSLVHAQRTQEQLRNDAEWYLPAALSEFRQFLRIENDGHYPDQIQQNLEWCVVALQKRKFETRILSSEGVPHVFGERIVNEKYPTVLIYMQIDGQPVTAEAWEQQNPFEAELKKKAGTSWQPVKWEAPYASDYRIFARSASDSKGPAMAFLSALDILDVKKIQPKFNMKVILDFQEEMGSPTLGKLVEANKDLFAAKLVLIMDGTRHVSNLPTLNFGARGIATITLTVFGPTTELHSGQYGNYAPNPVFKLAKLLADMKDESGKVLIPGFYEGVTLTEREKEILNKMPGDDAALNNRLGIAVPDQVANTYEESLQYPSLNIRGVEAATVGDQARTIIPSKAIAEIDMRLVPETPGERQVALVKEYILSRGFHIVSGEPTDEDRRKYANLISFEYSIGSKPFRTNLDSPIGNWLSAAMDRTFGSGNYVKQRTTGGSQPIEPFISTLGIPAVSLRFPNPDNNIHAANENISIGSFVEGIRMCLGVLTESMN